MIAIFFSFLCSILEAVVLSVPPSYIEVKIDEKSSLSKYYTMLKEDIDKPLSAILTLNTFAHTLGAAGVGAQAQIIWGKEYLSVISAVLTILILIFSEIIPKTLGASNWKALSDSALKVLRIIIFLLYPFVIISNIITSIMKRKEKEATLTRTDLGRLAEMVRREGSIGNRESVIIQNIIRFDKIKVQDILTPRTIITAKNEKTPIEDLRKEIEDVPFSRIPVYKENIDKITGFVLRNDIMEKLAETVPKGPLKDLRRKMPIVQSKISLIRLLEVFKYHKTHIAHVLDEYGGTEGIVTMEDLIESVLGMEIVDENDIVADLQEEARKKSKDRFR